MINAIDFRGVSKSYKKKIVLNDINFSVEQNKIFGIVGLNGIGKTTLLKILLGLAKSSMGEVKIFNTSISDLKVKNRLFFLPEKFNPSAFLTGVEFLEISLGFYNQKYNQLEANRICDELDFNPKDLFKPIGKYSKGMGQKLGLVSAFLANVNLLILDEPMSGLDPRARIFLKRKMKSFKDSNRSIFFTSHIMSDVEELCDDLGIIHNGRMYYNGQVDILLKSGRYNSLEDAFLKIIES